MRAIGLVILGLVSAAAQNIVITANDLLPVNSKIFYIIDTTTRLNFSPGPAGSGQNWNFTLDTLERDTAEILHPDSTPYANSFPTANRVQKRGNTYSYMNLQPSKLELIGMTFNVNGVPTPIVVQPDPFLFLVFPYQIGTTIQDTGWGILQFPGQPPFDSIRVKLVMIVKDSVDGDGTLTINGYTYNNVVRSVTYQYQADSVWGYSTFLGWQLVQSNPTRLTGITYTWFGKDVGSSVLTLAYNPTQDTLRNASFAENVVARQPKPQPLQAALYPNPVSSLLTIKLHIPLKGQLSIYNLNGQKLYTLPLQGRRTYTIPVAHFPEGSYFILVETAQGNYFARFNVVR